MKTSRFIVILILLILTIGSILIRNYRKSSFGFVDKHELPGEVYQFICNNISEETKQYLSETKKQDIMSFSFTQHDTIMQNVSFLSKQADSTLLKSLELDIEASIHKFSFVEETGNYGGLIKLKKLKRVCDQ